jgi:hypothetical protein
MDKMLEKFKKSKPQKFLINGAKGSNLDLFFYFHFLIIFLINCKLKNKLKYTLHKT